MVKTSCCAQSLVFSQVNDLDLGELLGRVLDEVAEDRLVVVSNNAYFLNVGDLCDGGETVPDDGVACNFEERLGGQLDDGRCEAGVLVFNIPLADRETKV